MRQKFLSARNGIAALFVILLSLCLAVGLWLAVPDTAYAETGDEQQSGEDADTGDTPEVNEWVISPSIVSWEYGSFDKKVNVISAQAKYGNETAVFRIFTAMNIEGSVNYVPVSYDNYEGDDASRTAFGIDENGIVPDFVAEKLATFTPGTYYLLGFVEATDGYTSLGGFANVTGAGYAFQITKVKSGWNTTPSIIPWTWKSFDRTVNVITAVPSVTGEEMEITYGVYTLPTDIEDYKVSGLGSFTTVGNANVMAEVTAETAALLNALDADTYYLGVKVHFTDSDILDDISGFFSFTVLPAQNYWDISPTVDQWTWDEFDFYNESVITSKPAHAAAGAEVTYGVYTTEDCVFSASGDNVLLAFTGVGADQKSALASLEAGDYWLKATLPATDNYTKLDKKVKFTVRRNPNYWASTPNVVRWTWGSFNEEENFITAEPKYGTDITYGIFRNKNCTDPADGLASFKNISEVAEYLKALPAENYWLRATTGDNNPNYNNISLAVSFSVLKAQNTWQTSPYVMSWKYGEYDRETNLINAVAAHGTAMFSIYTDEECTETNAVNFSETYLGRYHLFILENGLVPEYVAEKISTLDAGKYYLVARTLGNNDYSAINVEEGASVPFEIGKLTNYWEAAPSMKSWSEGHFDGAVNKLVGSAKVGDVKFTITDENNKTLFTITKSGDEITSVIRANGERVYLNELNTLPVGSYKLIAVVESTDNYSELSIEGDFAVFEDSVGLAGITAAAITFAVFDVIAAGVCIALIIVRRRKVEEQFRNMIKKELGR